MSEMYTYLEVGKVCPHCESKSLFFCLIINKEKTKGELGVKCRQCGYEAKLERGKE